MNYRTIVESKRYNFEVSHTSKILMLGSCFTENIGNKLIKRKFDVLVNPNGILFNPMSIAYNLSSIIIEKQFLEAELIQNNGMFHSFSHHGRFSSTSKQEIIELINKRRVEASDYLKNVDTLIITFGSAWVYRYLKTGEIVANCHKVPNKEFNKELLQIDEIVSQFKRLISQLKEINPNIQIIFTISPVRHWKDGAVENNQSKSILNIATHQLCKIENVHYFPSYEMVIDDLRDYRFYKEDMLHPNKVAINYVWKGFKNSFFNSATQSLMKELNEVESSANHKPLNPNSEKHQEFVKRQLITIEELSNKYPNLNFETELLTFKNQLL